jgi:hypothetical protein
VVCPATWCCLCMDRHITFAPSNYSFTSRNSNINGFRRIFNVKSTFYVINPFIFFICPRLFSCVVSFLFCRICHQIMKRALQLCQNESFYINKFFSTPNRFNVSRILRKAARTATGSNFLTDNVNHI